MANGARLPIHSASFIAISKDRLAVSLSTELKGPSGLGVHINPFDLHLYNDETGGFHPFISVPVPAQTIRGQTEIDIERTIASVKNHTELVKWLTKAVHQKTTNVNFRAKTTAHIGAIKAPIKINKTTSLHGLDRLSGVELSSMDLIDAKENDGNNFQGILMLPNCSPLSLGLGNLTLDTWAGDVLIGNATVINVHLKPGNNTIPFIGQVFLDSVMMNALGIIASQKSSLDKGFLELGISVNSTTANGESVTYLQDVLNDVKFTAQLHEHEVLRGLASSLIGPNKTVALSGMISELSGGLNPAMIMEFMGINITAWQVALEDALRGNTKPGTLSELFEGFAG